MIEKWHYGFRLGLNGKEVRWGWKHSWSNGWHETNLCKWFVAGTIILIQWL